MPSFSALNINVQRHFSICSKQIQNKPWAYMISIECGLFKKYKSLPWFNLSKKLWTLQNGIFSLWFYKTDCAYNLVLSFLWLGKPCHHTRQVSNMQCICYLHSYNTIEPCKSKTLSLRHVAFKLQIQKLQCHMPKR